MSKNFYSLINFIVIIIGFLILNYRINRVNITAKKEDERSFKGTEIKAVAYTGNIVIYNRVSFRYY